MGYVRRAILDVTTIDITARLCAITLRYNVTFANHVILLYVTWFFKSLPENHMIWSIVVITWLLSEPMRSVLLIDYNKSYFLLFH